MNAARMPRSPVVLIALLLLSGCPLTGEREQSANDYVRSLSSLLDVEASLSAIPTVRALPRMRQRRLELPDIEMGMVDFLSLYGCKLQVVVGERTSVLGRVAHPGTRMDYHLRFVDAARDCLPKIESSGRAEALRRAMETKKASVPEALWNGIWATSEIQEFFTRTGGTLPPRLRGQAFREARAHVERTLGLIRNLREGRLPEELERMSEVYEHWQSRPLMGQLLRSAEALATRLGDASAVIRRHLSSAGACSADGGAYRRFFRDRYLDGLAGRLRFVRLQRRRLVPAFRRLVDAPGAPVPEAMTPFIRRNLETASPDSVWHELDSAVRDHVAAWNELLRRCDRPRRQLAGM